MGSHAERGSPGRDRIARALQHLPAQAGRLCRDGPDPGIHPGQAPDQQPGVPQGGTRDRQSPPERRPRRGRSLYRRLHSLPSQDPRDPGYRRLRYCRYADDTLLGFAGPKAEAEEIKHRLAEFLREDLKLELSPEKTLITHARTQRARFLGYEISVAPSLSNCCET